MTSNRHRRQEMTATCHHIFTQLEIRVIKLCRSTFYHFFGV